jgi:NADPH2:quinone reductase
MILQSCRSVFTSVNTSLRHTLAFTTDTSNMKEAVITAGPKVIIRDASIPKPERGWVLIKVIYAGSNPKDWKVPEWMPDLTPRNQGNDVAGFVEAVGEGVTEFRVGDRVAAFLNMEGGGYAEYAVARAHTTFFLPENVSFQGQ